MVSAKRDTCLTFSSASALRTFRCTTAWSRGTAVLRALQQTRARIGPRGGALQFACHFEDGVHGVDRQSDGGGVLPARGLGEHPRRPALARLER
jgi:hypothetical protein